MAIEYELRRFLSKKSAVESQLNSFKNELQTKFAKLEEVVAKLDESENRILLAVEAYKKSVERSARGELRRAERKIKELEKKLEKGGGNLSGDDIDILAVSRAKTLAIFDAILFNISNWSNAGDTAPDFELVSQSILFPVVYEKIMEGDEEYLLDEVPVGALEVIYRGRQWVKHLRATCEKSLIDSEMWRIKQPTVTEWWLNDALPMIYGERNEEWDDIEPFAQQEMIAWRDFPANRALSFPRIFDGMESVRRYQDEIRETSKIPELDRQALKTRLEPNE